MQYPAQSPSTAQLFLEQDPPLHPKFALQSALVVQLGVTQWPPLHVWSDRHWLSDVQAGVHWSTGPLSDAARGVHATGAQTSSLPASAQSVSTAHVETSVIASPPQLSSSCGLAQWPPYPVPQHWLEAEQAMVSSPSGATTIAAPESGDALEAARVGVEGPPSRAADVAEDGEPHARRKAPQVEPASKAKETGDRMDMVAAVCSERAASIACRYGQIA